MSFRSFIKMKYLYAQFQSLKFATKLSLAFLLLVSLGLIYTDYHIRQQFEGKRWAVPAKVYARPLELYVGSPLSSNDLKV